MRRAGWFLVVLGTITFIAGGNFIQANGKLGLLLFGAAVLLLCVGTAMWARSHSLPWAWGAGGLLGPLGFLIVLSSTKKARMAAARKTEKAAGQERIQRLKSKLPPKPQ